VDGDRPRIGISACLLGEPVRYDGGHKRDAWLVDVLGPHVEWVPVCPEVEAGFGTPRETIDLVRMQDGAVAVKTTRTNRDVTETLRRYAARRVEELAGDRLSGYVLKADSPSCGPSGVHMRLDGWTPEDRSPAAEDPSRAPAGGGGQTGPGLFAAAIAARFPDLPIADEQRLGDPARRREFLERVFAHHRDASAGAGGPGRGRET
jgi:uncharacterized protein YbbK (DUF523 family)